MAFDESDIKKLKALNGIVKKGAFQITGEAVVAAASLFMWLDQLEPKIEQALKDADILGRQKLLPPSPTSSIKNARRRK